MGDLYLLFQKFVMHCWATDELNVDWFREGDFIESSVSLFDNAIITVAGWKFEIDKLNIRQVSIRELVLEYVPGHGSMISDWVSVSLVIPWLKPRSIIWTRIQLENILSIIIRSDPFQFYDNI